MQTLPILTERVSVDVQMINSQPIFSYYNRLGTLLERDPLDSSLVSFFAAPVIRLRPSGMSWVTQYAGDIRSFNELTIVEKVEAAAQLKQKCRRVRAIANRVGASATTAAMYGEQALLGMLSTPNALGSIFMVGDQVVIAQWGCKPVGDTEEATDLDVQLSKIVNSKANADRLAADSAAMARATKGSIFAGMWRWLVLSLLICLTVAGGLYEQTPVQVSAISSPAEENHLRIQIAQLWNKIDTKATSCSAPVKDPS